MDQLKNKLWVYSKPNQMVKHKYTDDVAITWAKTREEAWLKLQQLYNITEDDIREVQFNSLGVAILTDY